jgi:hypothetical protein
MHHVCCRKKSCRDHLFRPHEGTVKQKQNMPTTIFPHPRRCREFGGMHIMPSFPQKNLSKISRHVLITSCLFLLNFCTVSIARKLYQQRTLRIDQATTLTIYMHACIHTHTHTHTHTRYSAHCSASGSAHSIPCWHRQSAGILHCIARTACRACECAQYPHMGDSLLERLRMGLCHGFGVEVRRSDQEPHLEGPHMGHVAATRQVPGFFHVACRIFMLHVRASHLLPFS